MDPLYKGFGKNYPALSFSTYVYQSLKGMKTNGLTSVCVCVCVCVCKCVRKGNGHLRKWRKEKKIFGPKCNVEIQR